jgi:hypothetical protein
MALGAAYFATGDLDSWLHLLNRSVDQLEPVIATLKIFVFDHLHADSSLA